MNTQNINQNMDLLIPITVTPNVKVEEISSDNIKISHDKTEVIRSKGKYRFILKQRIDISIPLCIEAEVEIGEDSVCIGDISFDSAENAGR
ncbi:MAG TPA: hypothetical protein GXX17_00780 [Clostridiales bacterium]|nr:hypothetical protein [Clostridiales bacterium]